MLYIGLLLFNGKKLSDALQPLSAGYIIPGPDKNMEKKENQHIRMRF